MNKRLKSLAVFLLILMTTACAEDKYVSVRHPDDSNGTEVTDSDLEENNNDKKNKENNVDEDTGNNTGENTDQTDNEDNDEKESSDGVIYTVDDVVNVRLAPSENSAVITEAQPGKDIIKLGDSDNWTRVSIDGQTGYIRSDLIKEK